VADGVIDLSGLRILVVEDTLLIAELIASCLEDCRCTVVGPAGQLARGLALATSEALDGAFLDVDLAGQSSVSIAKELDARGIPYVFITGYEDLARLPPEYRGHPRLAKPFDPDQLGTLAGKHFRK
jgi:CheY-like chemotaxis protein